MEDSKKIKNLVVDTGAFLKNCLIQKYGENIYTTEQVIAEIKSKSAKDQFQFQVLPYDIKIKQPEKEDIIFAQNFAKKTGDYFTLSETDISVIALSITLERQIKGSIDHLKKNPNQIQVVNCKNNKFQTKTENLTSNEIKENEKVPNIHFTKNYVLIDSNVNKNKNENNENENNENLSEGSFDEESANQDNLEENEENYNTYHDDQSDEYSYDEEENNINDDEDEDGEWITPLNIESVKKQFDSLKLNEEPIEKDIETACITGDYSIQNVLIQIGIKVVSVEKGMLIKYTRQFVLRCFACFAITRNSNLLFCPSCGNLKTLKKVSVSVDENGQKKIHINFKKPITTKNVKLRIPRPRKGKFALNPILAADQHVPRIKKSKIGTKNKNLSNNVLLDIEYLIRDSPFSLNDVYSKSSRYHKTSNRIAEINNTVFNEGRKYANKMKKKRRN